MLMLKLVCVVALSYSSKVSASLESQARSALLTKEVASMSSTICGHQYGNEIAALKNGLKRVLAQAQDRRAGVNLEALKPNEQEAQFIAEQLCKSGRISDHEIRLLHSQYSFGSLDGSVQDLQYSAGDAKGELNLEENLSEQDTFEQPNDQSISSLISSKTVLAFFFGIIVGGVLLHYFVLVTSNASSPFSNGSKIRRPEL